MPAAMMHTRLVLWAKASAKTAVRLSKLCSPGSAREAGSQQAAPSRTWQRRLATRAPAGVRATTLIGCIPPTMGKGAVVQAGAGLEMPLPGSQSGAHQDQGLAADAGFPDRGGDVRQGPPEELFVRPDHPVGHHTRGR